MAKFFLQITMDVHLCALRIHQHARRAVVQIEREVQAFIRFFDPRTTLALLFPLPQHRAVVVAGNTGDGRGESVRSSRQPTDFDQSHGRAANFRRWCVHDQPFPPQQLKPVAKEVYAGGSPDHRPKPRGRLIRPKDECQEKHCIYSPIERIGPSVSGTAVSGQQETTRETYVGNGGMRLKSNCLRRCSRLRLLYRATTARSFKISSTALIPVSNSSSVL